VLQGSKFQQVFQLVPKAGGSYYIHNDIFRAGVAKPDNAPKEMAGDVVKSFVATYYQLFDSDRSKLAVVYVRADLRSNPLHMHWRVYDVVAHCAALHSLWFMQKPASSFTFEKNTLVGAEAIVKHLSVRQRFFCVAEACFLVAYCRGNCGAVPSHVVSLSCRVSRPPSTSWPPLTCRPCPAMRLSCSRLSRARSRYVALALALVRCTSNNQHSPHLFFVCVVAVLLRSRGAPTH